MKIGMVGLGKMGANMTRRLLQGGHQVVVFDLDEAAVKRPYLPEPPPLNI
jgi:6-phosphogluconate dehydrogenase